MKLVSFKRLVPAGGVRWAKSSDGSGESGDPGSLADVTLSPKVVTHGAPGVGIVVDDDSIVVVTWDRALNFRALTLRLGEREPSFLEAHGLI